MTTKVKIISGFGVMGVLLAVIGFVGYFNAERAVKNFNEYDRLAHFNVAMSDMTAMLFETSTNIYEFLTTKDTRDVSEARSSLAQASKQVESAMELVQEAERRDKLKQIQSKLAESGKLINELEKTVLEMHRIFIEEAQTGGASLMQQINGTVEDASTNGDMEALLSINAFWDGFAAARATISRYAASLSPEDAAKSFENLSRMESALATIGRHMNSAGENRRFIELNSAFIKYKDAFTRMSSNGSKALKLFETFTEMARSQSEQTAEVNSQVDRTMNEFRIKMESEGNSAQRQMLLLSTGGMLAGLIVAAFIVLGLIRVLRALASFANDVSKGNFDRQIEIREKGEIGDVITALRQIPTVLGNLMAHSAEMTDAIQVGRLRHRMETGSFENAFGELAGSFNRVGEAYTNVIDGMPLPFMSCDKNMQIQFLNRSAQSAVGSNYLNERCSQHLLADDCTNNCFGRRAMSENATVSGETIIHPQGNRFVVNVTAVPLRDSLGQIAGFTEVLSDITEIRDNQAAVRKITHEASAIADRVAAASEEIAAQIEQISRGADVQRYRVESTASAMTEMNSTVMEVARNAGMAAEQTDGTRQKAETGADLVLQVVDSINEVNTVALSMQANMQDLGKQAENIGGVMGVISDIADQTNLLALNAAIEAARAGEAGRGFAVVADEVRKLAEKTMHATQEVGNSIGSIQQSTRKNIEVMESAASQIGGATALARTSGEALSEIVQLAAASSEVVTSIATAAEEQSATSEEINRAVEEINAIVNETTVGISQSSIAVQELASTAQELRRMMERLS